MNCEISPGGKCGRSKGQIGECGNCSEFRSLTIGAELGGEFKVVYKNGVHELVDKEGKPIMTIEEGRFTKFAPGE